MGFPSYKEDIDRMIDESLAAYGLNPPADLLALVRQVIGSQIREIIRSQKANTADALARASELTKINGDLEVEARQARAKLGRLTSKREELQQQLKSVEVEMRRLRSELASEKLHVKQVLQRYADAKEQLLSAKEAQKALSAAMEKLSSLEAEVSYLRPLVMQAVVTKRER